MNFFRAEKLTPTTTAITDLTGVRSFLVEGEKEAVLIDTGTGAGNLKDFVVALTELPITVLLTHGHCDHAGGAAGFERVYLAPEDMELVKTHASLDSRKEYISFIMGDQARNIRDEDHVPEREGGYLPLEDGAAFDLGGVHLAVIAVPGHTQGIVCVLHREERWILFGDACNNSTFLWAEESTSVEEYREHLLRLKVREEDYDTVLLSHGPAFVEKTVLDDVIELCDDIMAETDDAIPFSFMGEANIQIAKEVDPERNRIDGKIGNIIYNKQKIYRREA